MFEQNQRIGAMDPKKGLEGDELRVIVLKDGILIAHIDSKISIQPTLEKFVFISLVVTLYKSELSHHLPWTGLTQNQATKKTK